LYFYLPKGFITANQKTTNSLEYKKYNIKSAFHSKSKEKKVIEAVVPKKKEYMFLSNVILVAVYAMENNSGFIVVKEKKKNNTEMLSLNEQFKGYTLTKIFTTYVIFTKSSKEYKLSMIINNQKIEYQEVVTKPKKQPVEINDDSVAIKRDVINSYVENFDKIWNDISIQEVRTAKGIDGFKVNKVRKNSIFDKLGLKAKDILKSVNNIELKSYNDAFKIYKKIDNIKDLNLKILRDGIEEEIIYEIK
jgi:general secretion pathway protein C